MFTNVSTRNTLRYDRELCNGCGMCRTVCPHGVFAHEKRLARLVEPDVCMECGACQLNCPTGALKVDSGVGCATAMMIAAIKGRKEVSCGPTPECASQTRA
jgi:NAD-dependent dihydropyrimidine dehydrogenase PreA subunit